MMQQVSFLNKIWFHAIVPLFYGVLVYILILLFFDSLQQLTTNFLGVELAVIVFITYLVFLALYFINRLFEKSMVSDTKMKRQIFLQLLIGLFISLTISALVMSIYFRFFIKYSKFLPELIIVSVLFSFSGMFYNIFHYSIFYLNKQNTLAIDQEKHLHDTLIQKFQGFMQETRPEFFFAGLEALIILIRKDIKKADKFIQKLAEVYRYTLESRKSDLVDLKDELKQLDNLKFLFNEKFNKQIRITQQVSDLKLDLKLKPGTIQILLEESVFSSIISNDSHMDMHISDRDGVLCIKHNGLQKLVHNYNQEEIKELTESQKYYSGKDIQVNRNVDETQYLVPLISDEISNLE